MRYSREHAERTAVQIREAASRGFRAEGYAGLSIDAIAKEAGVTSGAFYRHYRSKSEAFREVVQAGLDTLRTSIAAAQAKSPHDWVSRFSRVYLGLSSPRSSQSLSLPVDGGCVLPTLAPELTRCDEETRAACERELLKLLDEVVAGLPGPGTHARRTGWSYLALLTGAVVLARAVPDKRVAKEILQAALNGVAAITRPDSRADP